MYCTIALSNLHLSRPFIILIHIYLWHVNGEYLIHQIINKVIKNRLSIVVIGGLVPSHQRRKHPLCRGNHGNPATACLQAPVTLSKQWKCILTLPSVRCGWVNTKAGALTHNAVRARANQSSLDHADKTLTKAETPPPTHTHIFGCDRWLSLSPFLPYLNYI